MPRAPSGSPPYHNGFMPNFQPFASEKYTASPNFGQQYQQGMCFPTVDPNMWYQSYYQGRRGFHTQLQYSGYPTDPNHISHYFDHSIKDRSTSDVNMGHRKYSSIGTPGLEPVYWQSPPHQYMGVPHNSPNLSPVNQNELQTSPAEFHKLSSRPKRQRGTTIPGADAPSLQLFEGSRKPAWGVSGDSRPKSQRNEGQKPSYPRDNSFRPSSGSSSSSKKFHRPFISQDARNFPAPGGDTQPFTSRHGETLHTSLRYNNERSQPWLGGMVDANIRKQYLIKPAMIQPAVQNIRWVEMSPRDFNASGNSCGYMKPHSSISFASMSPISTSSSVHHPLPPLIFTSFQDIVKSVPQSASDEFREGNYAPSSSDSLPVQPSFSQCTVENFSKSTFTFNPTAADFVFVLKNDSSNSFQPDEYVGFYISPEATYSCPSSTNTSPFVYACDPMAWQVPHMMTSLESQSIESCPCGDQSQSEMANKEFIGKAPRNINWSKDFAPIDSGKAASTTWASWDSEDETAILDPKMRAGIVHILNETRKRLSTSLKVVESDTEISNDIENRKFTGGDDQKILVGSTLEVEVTQTVDDTQVFEEDPQNVVKFPGCGDIPLEDNRAETPETPENIDYVLSDPELIVETCGLIEGIAKLPENDHKQAMKTNSNFVAQPLDWANCVGNVENYDQHAVDKPQGCFQNGGAVGDYTEPVIVEATVEAMSEFMLGGELGITSKFEKEVALNSTIVVGPEVRSENNPHVKPRAKQHTQRKISKSRPIFEKKSGSKIEERCQAKKASTLSDTPNILGPVVKVTNTRLVAPDTLITQESVTNGTTKAVMTPDSYSTPEPISVENRQEITPELDSHDTPKPTTNRAVLVPPFNYRDALLKKADNPQTSFLPSSRIKNNITASIIPTQLTRAKAKVSGPATETRGRRKFFLHPIPISVTYDSITKQLRGGMLEDIYISGLSTHPSAWKGPKGKVSQMKGNQLDRKDSQHWYAHVSFYSEKGASNFWELVNIGKESSSGPYRSLYGGFDDQEPGFFVLDGLRVFVNWRHNDQRVVNPLTERAVLQENATRCLLLTFNTETAMQSWSIIVGGANNQGVEEETEGSTKPMIVGDELTFINKVAAVIGVWGQADSNLQGIRILHDNAMNKAVESEKVPAQQLTIKNPTNSTVPKEVRVLVSFIKLLTAIKLRRHLLTQPEYGPGGYCKVEYYKDECAGSIEVLKAIREGSVLAGNSRSKGVVTSIMDSTSIGRGSYEQRRRRNLLRAGKENTIEANTAGRKEKTSGNKGK